MQQLEKRVSEIQTRRGGFEKGELVVIRQPVNGGDWRVGVVGMPHHTLVMNGPNGVSIGIGKYKNNVKGNHVVEASWVPSQSKPGVLGENLIIKTGQTLPLPTGREADVLSGTEPARTISLSFEAKEKVRYRGADGLMQEGTYVDPTTVATPEGKRLAVKPDEVFKTGNGFQSVTPKFAPSPGEEAGIDYRFLAHQFLPPNGAARAFLNGGAMISSLPDFKAREPEIQFNVLLDYFGHFMKPNGEVTDMMEVNGLVSVRDFLCAGLGSCRHNVSTFGTLLAESGYSVRVVVKPAVGGARPGGDRSSLVEVGHTWLEVDLLVGGKTETWIVDPTVQATDMDGKFIRYGIAMPKTEGEAEATNPASLSAKYYLSPNRRYFRTSPVLAQPGE